MEVKNSLPTHRATGTREDALLLVGGHVQGDVLL